MRIYLSILLLIFYASLSGQEKARYFIDGDEVVFEFNLQDYQVDTEFKSLPDFPQLNLSELTQGMQEWSHQGWHLVHKLNDVFQLRKSVDDFAEASTSSKYLISPDYWTGPSSVPISEIGEISDSFKLTVSEKPRKVIFRLDARKGSDEVILAGSFNNWNERALKMQRINHGWELDVELQPGIYEYKFIVDHEWTHDQKNPLNVLNEHNTLNSILLVGESYEFHLAGHEKARKVVLSGSFANWDEKALLMKKFGDGWKLKVPLPPGKHFYKFIIDGQWTIDPENPLQQYDRDGNINSVRIIADG